jgi:glycosyltransferase involved in cell wall biosynthesis
MHQISHFVGLSGIGGVQRNFVEYLNIALTHDIQFCHKVYTLGEVDNQYKMPIEVLDIRKIRNFIQLIKDMSSKDTIVHFYNNLSSFKVALLLLCFPVNKLILHERGTIWNQPLNRLMVPLFVARKSDLILSNSLATQTMLSKKLGVLTNKIAILHNGISIGDRNNSNYIKSKYFFCIGFIGRIDSPKGLHVLIDAMRYLTNEKIKLKVAGDGPLKNYLKAQASDLLNIEFLGRVNNPYDFMQEIDLLIVPSIREPLGNVCLEAGLCKTPVLASNVDGLPEIIENSVSGELINPTDSISIKHISNATSLPELIVDPFTQELIEPKQINPYSLANKIIELSRKPELLESYSNKLHQKVVKFFNIDRYTLELHKIYREMF